ncbi:MAG: hypothetical protein K2N45_05555 [Helicobacter japonicus]|nr:hypothetical protein [Helicobacter japonicus]
MSENIENELAEQDSPITAGDKPESAPESQKSTIDRDEDFVNELLERIDKRLEQKLYYGRKQEKSDKKSQKKLEKVKESIENENTIFYFASGILFFGGCIIAYFGFKALKREGGNENS